MGMERPPMNNLAKDSAFLVSDLNAENKSSTHTPLDTPLRTALETEVKNRFGVLPNFFRLATENLAITANLWGFARFAYLDNPLPSLFKERLFVYLSRFCEVRYCIVRHVGFLVGLGHPSGDWQCPVQTVSEVVQLLQRPFPRGKHLEPHLALCATSDAPVREIPEPDSELEKAIVACASHIFLQTPEAPLCLDALKHVLGESRFDHLSVFLAFVRTAHYWTRIHPELSFEEDVTNLLDTHQTLAECLLNDPESISSEVSQRLLDELLSLRERNQNYEALSAEHEELLRTHWAERKQLGAALLDKEARLRAIFDGTYGFILLLSPRGTALDANRATLEWTGATREEIVGKSIWETPLYTNTPGAPDQARQAVYTAENGEFVRQEVELRNPSGEVTIFDFSLHPVRDEQGKVILLVSEGRDVTEQVRVRKAVEEANRLKDEFLATLSHELRSPLNSIVGYSEVLLRSPEARHLPLIQQAAEAIYRNAHAQAQLINDLLDLARLQTGKLSINLRPVNLAPVIGDAVESLRSHAGEKNIKLDVDFTAEPLSVNADPVRVQQIVWNLVTNAVKFTPKGGQISVSLRRKDDEAMFVIEDTGQGIEPDFIPHIFEMFRQADARTTRSHGGMGIGLALVHQLTELHDGRIEAHSEGRGRGACFTVRIPLHSIAPIDQAAETLLQNDGELAGVRILVVDDTQDTLNMLQLLLAGVGAEVKTALSGEDGLRMAADAEFDLIISDISMPGMDGHDFIQRLKADQRYAKTPAIALTGFGREEDIQRARQAGFKTHITKPLDFNDLVRIARLVTPER
jgi:PAS domain S-box-containing protein